MHSDINTVITSPLFESGVGISPLFERGGGGLFKLRLIFIYLVFCVSCSYSQAPLYRFAIIGDFGYSGDGEFKVSELVKSWNPAFVVSLGDNNYELGQASTIDENIGKYYHEFIYPYKGSFGHTSSHGAADSVFHVNRFFPCLGNHDWYTDNGKPYFDYFELPGNERYYDFVKPPLHFFILDSDINEPDGISQASAQARWLRQSLASSKQPYKIVYFHEPPYSSGFNGSSEIMRWQFKRWGASLVLSGHDHSYERLNVGNFTYIVNGLGGRSIYPFDYPVQGSKKRYNGNYGAQLAEVFPNKIKISFITVSGFTIDSYVTEFVPFKLTKKDDTAERFLLQDAPKKKFTIKFQLPKVSSVKVSLLDTLETEIVTLADETFLPGSYEMELNIRNLQPGTYLYRLNAEVPASNETFTDTKRLIVPRLK